MMRIVYSLLVIIFVTLVTLFALQNLQSVTIAFLNMRTSLPLALLVVGTYFLGLLTGGALLALVRHWIRGARRR